MQTVVLQSAESAATDSTTKSERWFCVPIKFVHGASKVCGCDEWMLHFFLPFCPVCVVRFGIVCSCGASFTLFGIDICLVAMGIGFGVVRLANLCIACLILTFDLILVLFVASRLGSKRKFNDHRSTTSSSSGSSFSFELEEETDGDDSSMALPVEQQQQQQQLQQRQQLQQQQPARKSMPSRAHDAQRRNKPNALATLMSGANSYFSGAFAKPVFRFAEARAHEKVCDVCVCYFILRCFLVVLL